MLSADKKTNIFFCDIKQHGWHGWRRPFEEVTFDLRPEHWEKAKDMEAERKMLQNYETTKVNALTQ